ncbi:MAG: hypothetical protein Q9175_003296 [Cornicularia normoerica]
MVFINGFRFRALILTVYISLNSWVAASASMDSVRLSRTANLVSPTSGLESASVSAFQTATSLNSTSKPASHTTSGATEPSPWIAITTKIPTPGSVKVTTTVFTTFITHFINAVSKSASSTSHIPASHVTSSGTEPSTLIAVNTKTPSPGSAKVVFAVSTAFTTQFVTAISTSASSTSRDPSSLATESSTATFVPGAPPSNSHIAKLAEIIVPSVVGGAGMGWAIGPKLWTFFGKLAETQPGESAASVARSMKMARQTQLLEKLSTQQQQRALFYERRILMEEGRNPGTLTTDQANRIRAVERGGESIWNGKDIPSLPEPCPGEPFCIDWPGSPPGSAPPSAPDPQSDPNPPSSPDPPSNANPPSDPNTPLGPKPPSDPKPPSNPEPPLDPNPPLGPDPPSNPNPPSDPKPPSGPDLPSNPKPPSDPKPPSGPDPPSNPNPPSDPKPPPGPEPPPPATEEDIRLANEVPPLPKALQLWGRFADLGLVRLVPEAYRTLPIGAKKVYVTKYGENVWSQRLRYFKGAETAAVDSQNKPLNDWNFDGNGDLVDYQGKTASDIRKGNLPKGVDRNKLEQGFVHMRAEIEMLEDMEDVERARISNANLLAPPQGPPQEPPQHNLTPAPPEPPLSPLEPTPSPPEPTTRVSATEASSTKSSVLPGSTIATIPPGVTPFTVVSARSGSPIQYHAINAASENFYINMDPRTNCPASTTCPAGKTTTFYVSDGLAFLAAPGSQQQIYVHITGSLKFVPPGNGTLPDHDSYTAGFSQTPGGAFGKFGFTGASSTGFRACPTSKGAKVYQVFAAIKGLGNADVPSGDVSDCLGFDALTHKTDGPGAWEYV